MSQNTNPSDEFDSTPPTHNTINSRLQAAHDGALLSHHHQAPQRSKHKWTSPASTTSSPACTPRAPASRARLADHREPTSRASTPSSDSSSAAARNEYAHTLATLAAESAAQRAHAAQEARWRALAQATIDQQASLVDSLEQRTAIQAQRIA
jgi:hypothetical protein